MVLVTFAQYADAVLLRLRLVVRVTIFERHTR
jgi:hypothetical protein